MLERKEVAELLGRMYRFACFSHNLAQLHCLVDYLSYRYFGGRNVLQSLAGRPGNSWTDGSEGGQVFDTVRR